MKKVYDFNEHSECSGIVGRPRNLAWPCEMFRVTLPKAKPNGDSEYNAIELCVLKLLSYDHYEPKDLAEEICLPKDLIEVILLRLYDRGSIDEHYKLKPDVFQLIEKQNSEKDEIPTDFVSFVVFRECIGNSILPMIMDGKNLRAEEINERGDIDKGNNRTITLHKLQKTEKGDKKEMITVHEMSRTLRTMARRLKLTGKSYSLPSHEYISIESTFEPCDLYVRMVLQNNGDWRILNPFGKGWSPELELSYRKLLYQDKEEGKSLQEWQKKNLASRVQAGASDERPREPYDTKENNVHYPQLLAALNRKRDVYAILEWALFYSLRQFDIKKIVNIFRIDTPADNERRLMNAVEALTSKPTRSRVTIPLEGEVDSSQEEEAVAQELTSKPAPQLIRVPLEGKVSSFQNEGMAEMSVVLPLAVLLSQEEPRFPLYKVFQEYPDFLERVSDLKGRHDSKRHGKNRWAKIYGEDDYSFMKKVVNLLLPSVLFSDSPASKEDAIGIDPQLHARISLQDVFGVDSFDRMDSILQDCLLQVEIIRQELSEEDKPFDALHGINSLYAAMQGAFRPQLKGKRPKDVSMSLASKKARESGLGGLPQSLSNVRLEMIERTLDGYDQTLGASAVAWLLLSDIDMLQNVASRHSSFLSDLDRLLALDKHGNQICMMKPTDFSTLSDTVYKLIITITEA